MRPLIRRIASLFRGPRPAPRRPRRLRVEALDDRSLPSVVAPDVAVLSARLESPTTVRFDYLASGSPAPFQVGVYRSADPSFGAGDVPVGTPVRVTPPADGTHSGRVPLASELPTDPERKFVLVVADPGHLLAERSESNNTASFRKLVVGGVAHGFTLTGTRPAWLDETADALEAAGYDEVIRLDWTALSQTPVPYGTVLAGRSLAALVRQEATELATRPGDVVDVHLIGHSRGTAVVSQAFRALELSPGPAALRLGYYRETLLDPHVARNFGTLAEGLLELRTRSGESTVGQFSYDPSRLAVRTFAAGVLAFQAATRDPAAFVPANVDAPEVFYQRLRWSETAPGSEDRALGVNFLSDLPATLRNESGEPIRAVDVGAFGVGHYGVPEWYLENEVPGAG